MSARVRHLRHCAADQGGFALPTALAVLVITLLLAGAAVAVATNTNAFSNRDTNSQAALAAADAGARAAIYRLNSFAPDDTHCPDPSNAAVGSSGAPTSSLCPPQSETLGNGESFTYWMSGALSSSSPCSGYWMTSTLGDLHQRCVTVIGTANGVSARIQERIAAYKSYALFPTAIFGTKSVTINNNVNIQTNTVGAPALLGTNGVLNAAPSGGGTTVIDGYQLPPGATLNLGQNVTNNGPTTPYPTPYPTPTAINPGSTAVNTSSPYDTATTFQGGTCLSPGLLGFEQTNCDYRISCPDKLSCDSSHGTVQFDPVKRTLYLGNNASLVLGGGYYNFCSLYLSNNSSITIAPGVQTSIYIDSPADPASGTTGSATNPPCSKSNSAQGVAPGTFTMSQNSTLYPQGGSALDAEIFVYGDPQDDPPTNNVNLQNNGSSTFALVAPFSNVNVSPSNNSVFVGAIVGYTVTLGNKSHFTYEADTGPLQNPALGLYYRAYWQQCATKPSSVSDPSSGC